MVEVQTRSMTAAASTKPLDRQVNVVVPPTSIDLPAQSQADRFRSRLAQDSFSPVNQNGSFEFDRVIKSGYVQKRTQKTKTWKPIYLVLRPNTLYMYKSDREEKLRHKIYLSDLTAVTLLKDPKHKRQNVFGLFSPAKNFHLEAPTLKDAKEWVELIRKDARIEEDEEEMFLASPVVQRRSFMGFATQDEASNRQVADRARMISTSPDSQDAPSMPVAVPSSTRRPSHFDSSGMSGGELASHSEGSDTDAQRLGASIESLTMQPPPNDRPEPAFRTTSQGSGVNVEPDPDRVVWQGRLLFLRSKGGVRQWKNMWAVLRPRNLILYKDASEYLARFIIPMSSVVNVVDIDPISRTKTHCLQIITDEKSYRFCAHSEETLVQCLGAFKSLLTKRRELEAKVAAANLS